MRELELLAPAGDIERLKVALLYGADAVYVGGTMFGLRANAINFTIEDLKEALSFAHNLSKKVYVTVNIALHNKEAKALLDYLKELEEIGVDAIIVSDPAVLKLAKENTNLRVFISTQQSTLNYEAVEFWKNEGAERIILGREATYEEIKEITNKVDVEIETFIHGAMCASYSGRCVLSNFFTDRDANRGGCAQICRWDFDLLDENKEALVGEKPFTFCSKDLSLAAYIPEMIDAGITSFKIEGRMRSVYYIATIVNVYRKLIDNYVNDPEGYKYDSECEKVLRRCANRDAVAQFFNNDLSKNCQYYNGREEVSNQDFLGMVLDQQDNLVTVEERNYFQKGDVVEVFGPKTETFTMTIDEIYDEEGNLIEVVRHPKQVVKIRIKNKVFPYDMIRIKTVDKR